jgi:hypothetical protein
MEYGIYERLEILPGKMIVSGPDGREFQAANFKHIKQTSIVPALRGVCFGYEFEIENIPLICFDHDYEIKSGQWIFQIRHAGKVIVQKAFEVVPDDS